MTFSSALSVRAVDPMIPQIAHDFWLPPATAAMLAAAFISYGMVLPVLGPVADFVGKKRVMIGCLVVLTIVVVPLRRGDRRSSSCSCFASSPAQAAAACFRSAWRCCRTWCRWRSARSRSDGCWPAPSPATCWASAAAGIVADFIHWRGVFIVLGVISLIALVLAVVGLRGLPEAPRQPLDPRTVILRYRAIFRDPDRADLLPHRAVRGHFPDGAVRLCRGAAARGRRAARLDRRPRHRVVRRRRHRLFARHRSSCCGCSARNG